MNKTALYVRVSTIEQAEHGYSLDEQVERMKKYCDAMGWNICGIYTDPGFSGASTERPGLAKLIADVEAGKVDKVLVYKLDRLSRSQKDTLHLIEDVFLAHGVDFVSMSENFDTATPLGRAMIGILSVFAQLEREQIKERMIMGKDARAKKGLFHGSASVPIGYDYTDGELVPNDEAAQVLQAFKMYDGGSGVYQIAAYFNRTGLQTKHGRWKHMTVYRVLQNPVYIGKLRYKGEVYEAHHAPIVTEELFARVQEKMTAASETVTVDHRRPWKSESYLGGLLVCGKCGAHYRKYFSQRKNKAGEIVRYNYYSCATRRYPHISGSKGNHCDNKIWQMDELDDIILGEVKKLSLHPIEIQPAKQENEIMRQSIKSELAKVQAQISKLIDLYALDGIAIETIQQKIAELNEQKERLEAALEETLIEERLTPSEASEIATTFCEIFSVAKAQEIKRILALLIAKIELDEENIKIYWNFS